MSSYYLSSRLARWRCSARNQACELGLQGKPGGERENIARLTRGAHTGG